MTGWALMMWIGGQWFFGSVPFLTKEDCEAQAYFYKLPHKCYERALTDSEKAKLNAVPLPDKNPLR